VGDDYCWRAAREARAAVLHSNHRPGTGGLFYRTRRAGGRTGGVGTLRFNHRGHGGKTARAQRINLSGSVSDSDSDSVVLAKRRNTIALVAEVDAAVFGKPLKRF